MRRTRPALVLAVTGLLVAATAGCGGDDADGSGGGDGPGGTPLALVPADATTVEIVDRAAAAERIGADQETGASGDEVADYAKEMGEKAPWGGTELDQWIVPMTEGKAPFTALDVVRQTTFTVDNGAPTKLWEVGDDVDLAALGKDLESSGFEASEDGGVTTYTADLGLADPTTQLVDGKYPVLPFREVTVVPDEHLVVAGPADDVLAVLHGEDSLEDAGTLDAVAGRHGDAEFLAMTTGDGVLCGAGGARPGELEGSGLEDLGAPEQVAFAITGEGAVAASASSTFGFADAEAAEADADARETYLDEGTTPRTQQPISDLLDGFEISTAGPVETVDYTLGDGARRALQMYEYGEVVTACNPG